jgi:hypothetical protein
VTDTRWQLAAYVFVSIVLCMVAAQFSQRRREFPWMRYLSPDGWPASILRFAYYVGLPYIALILGVVPGRYLGLVGLNQLAGSQISSPAGPAGGGLPAFLARLRSDISLLTWSWLPGLPTLIGLALLMLVLLVATWLVYGHVRRRLTSDSAARRLMLPGRLPPRRTHVVYQAIHWSFYRSAVWLLVGDLYLAVVGGILLVVAEWVLQPAPGEGLGYVLSRETLFVDASLLIATAVIFFFVPNLWLLVPVHWLLLKASRWAMSFGQRGISVPEMPALESVERVG